MRPSSHGRARSGEVSCSKICMHAGVVSSHCSEGCFRNVHDRQGQWTR
jgi:hypothetical protein